VTEAESAYDSTPSDGNGAKVIKARDTLALAELKQQRAAKREREARDALAKAEAELGKARADQTEHGPRRAATGGAARQGAQGGRAPHTCLLRRGPVDARAVRAPARGGEDEERGYKVVGEVTKLFDPWGLRGVNPTLEAARLHLSYPHWIA